MGFIYAPGIEVGDIYIALVDEPGALPLMRGDECEISSVDAGGFGWLEGGWVVDPRWIVEGKLKKKEKAMAFVYEEEEQAQPELAPVEELNWGAKQLQQMNEVFNATDAAPHSEVLKDGLNHRYRSTAYRDYIKLMKSQGHITEQQITHMRNILASYRYTKRTPASKAWRHQWP